MPPISTLTDHTGYWLRMVSNAVSQDFARKVAAHGVTVAEWCVLRAVFDGALAPTLLADQMGLTRGAISKLADRVMAKGLISRTDSETDRRAQVLALTPAGCALVPVLAALADANDAAFFDHLPPEDRQSLDRCLRLLARRRGLTATPTD